ncbi:RES family NAD+ phosphorylase [Mesorhizobium sp. CGMCC 1.15528]|uniref:RES family NAD+ phosphorylase n=1 Tax=Mesorhizobium zhangyense TaxID=1776730 RepID=A0A7C9R6G8_9HYPH|nr:RES family NAD+ phosphorylase [Mesorhizobium zhangyense]NGN41079.1 RES family NAD+ phosphorylase [Mesorhizobium zhangyense]
MTETLSPAPRPAHRLIPSQFPPIGLFDTVATAADLTAVMDLVGWTNDRLVADRIDRLSQSEWVYGRPNASIVMAAFLHVPPTGARFNGAELGAWYAAADLTTAATEVGHHLRREAVARGLTELKRKYRAYTARLEGEYVDIRGLQASLPALYAPDSYAESQPYGEGVRASRNDGILYDSVRLRGGICVAAYRPSKIEDVVQADHFEITVWADRRTIDVRKLKSGK